MTFLKKSAICSRPVSPISTNRCADLLIDALRQELKKYTILVEIPPAPWGHPYMVALTHDVDITSVRECRILTVGYAAYQCFKQGNFRAGFNLFCAKCGIGPDPWSLFRNLEVP